MKELECFCGEERYLTYKIVSNIYEKIEIEVINVPVYVCDNGHDKLSRLVSYSLKHLLEKARSLNKTVITYEEYKI